MEGEMLEAKFRQGENLVRLERSNEAIETLQKVIERRQASKDWHNEARAIDLILQTDKKESYCQYMGRLLDIYGSVLCDQGKMKVFKAQAFRFSNASEFFKNAVSKAELIERPGIASDLKKCFQDLERTKNAWITTNSYCYENMTPPQWRKWILIIYGKVFKAKV